MSLLRSRNFSRALTSRFGPRRINLLHQVHPNLRSKATFLYSKELGNLPISTLLNEVKRLHDIAYELGIEERKEMTRGKYINIFRKKN